MKHIGIFSVFFLLATFTVFAKKIVVSPSITSFTKGTAVQYDPAACDKPIIEWYSDSIPFEMIDHYEVYQYNKTWQKIAQIKKDTFYCILKGNFIAGSKYSFKVAFVLKSTDVYESLPVEYEHMALPAIQPVTIVKQEFKTINGVKYLHVTWELPKGYNETTDEFLVMFESTFTPNQYSTYQNFVEKSKNEEYFEVYQQSVGKKFSFYILTRRDFSFAPPSPKFTYVVE